MRELETHMNRETFIREYLNRSPELTGAVVTEYGFRTPEHERWALPCACGAPECTGWAMVHPRDVGAHIRAFGHKRAG